MRRKGRVPASETRREPPFGARRTGGAGEDHLGAGGLNLSKPLRTPPLPGSIWVAGTGCPSGKKSGTAEVLFAFVSLRDKGVFVFPERSGFDEVP